MDSDEPEDPRKKVVSLRFRRKQKAEGDERTSGDPVAILADEITQLLGRQQLREVQQPDKARQFEFACNQLLAQVFATNALMKVFMHSLGPTMYNSVMVEVEQREHRYRVQTPWPQDSADTTTYADFITKEEDLPDAKVIPFKPRCGRCGGRGSIPDPELDGNTLWCPDCHEPTSAG